MGLYGLHQGTPHTHNTHIGLPFVELRRSRTPSGAPLPSVLQRWASLCCMHVLLFQGLA